MTKPKLTDTGLFARAKEFFGENLGVILYVENVDSPVSAESVNRMVMDGLTEAAAVVEHRGPWQSVITHDSDCPCGDGSDDCTCDGVVAMCKAITTEEADRLARYGDYDELRDMRTGDHLIPEPPPGQMN